MGTECIQKLVVSAIKISPDSKRIGAKIQYEHKGYTQEGIPKEPHSEQRGPRTPKE